MTTTSNLLPAVRRGILAILVFAFAGTLTELYLLEHYEGWKQWVPLAVLALGAVTGGALLVSASEPLLRLWRALMVVYLVAGGAGVWFHYSGNLEFELERTPDLTGLALARSTLEGATPVLAPGTMVQFGLLGLLFAWRHPARRDVG